MESVSQDAIPPDLRPTSATGSEPVNEAKVLIRPATIADSHAIARVCVLTDNQGHSAENLLRHPELPAQVNALPYLHLASGFGFVLVETIRVPQEKKDVGDGKRKAVVRREKVVGYVVGTAHAKQFELETEASWWPIMRIKYPQNLIGTPLDRYYIGLIHKDKSKHPERQGLSARINVCVNHEYQQQGCDKLLIDVAVHHLRQQGFNGYLRTASHNDDC